MTMTNNTTYNSIGNEWQTEAEITISLATLKAKIENLLWQEMDFIWTNTVYQTVTTAKSVEQLGNSDSQKMEKSLITARTRTRIENEITNGRDVQRIRRGLQISLALPLPQSGFKM